MSIHVIDDETFITEVLADLLSEYSDQICCFHSAEEYLLHMHADDYIAPKLIISDIMMGEMDGYELIQQIRQVNTVVKIIIMSGYNNHYMVEKHYDAAISKPFNIEQLQSTVALSLSGDLAAA